MLRNGIVPDALLLHFAPLAPLPLGHLQELCGFALPAQIDATCRSAPLAPFVPLEAWKSVTELSLDPDQQHGMHFLCGSILSPFGS